MADDLYERIKRAVLQVKPTLYYERVRDEAPQPVPVEEAPEAIEREAAGYLDKAGMTHMIRKAAQQTLLLNIRYNNQWRYVEPYSFRDGKQGILLYGHCLMHNRIHSFYLHRIQGLKMTDMIFSPRWTIEF